MTAGKVVGSFEFVAWVVDLYYIRLIGVRRHPKILYHNSSMFSKWTNHCAKGSDNLMRKCILLLSSCRSIVEINKPTLVFI